MILCPKYRRSGGTSLDKKVGLVSLGCSKNLVDSETMLGILQKAEYQITHDEKAAQIIIINTCGFIDESKQESINSILEFSQYKQKYNCEKLIVTGCLAERYKDEIIVEIPEVDAVVGTGDFWNISNIIKDAYEAEDKQVFCDNINSYNDGYSDRIVSTNHYAYIKIAEGCNNHCTFCIIPKLRGKLRSRNMESILEEAERLVHSGFSELILVAQDTTVYGLDLYGKQSLVDLLIELEKINDLKRIRIMYCYPEGITDELINILAKSQKICKYIDMPIQHASYNILKKMGRRGNIDYIQNLISVLRKNIPDIILRTSLITGFPGETEQDFKILRDFVIQTEFDRLGVFVYSPEEGTAAATFEHQVPQKLKVSRRNSIMQLQKQISASKNLRKIGKQLEVIVEGLADDGLFYYGRSYADCPEVDGKVFFVSKRQLTFGKYVNVKILDCDDYDLIGEEVEI